MIKRFGTLYAGQVDLEGDGLRRPASKQPLDDNDHLVEVFDTAEQLAETMDASRLRHAVAGRAPLPARRLRVHPQHPDAGGPSGPPDRAASSSAAASTSCRCGTRCGWPRTTPPPTILTGGRVLLRRRPRLSHARGRDVRRADARPRRQPRAVRRAGRDHLQSLQRARPFAPRQALHDPPRVAYRGYELEEITLVPRPLRAPGRAAGSRSSAPASAGWTSWPATASRALSAAARPAAGAASQTVDGLAGGAGAPRPRDRAGRRPGHRADVPHRRHAKSKPSARRRPSSKSG